MLLAVAASAWVLLLLAAPALPATVAAATYTLGSLICHQLPERSFHVGAAQLPVCARCIGIYMGVAIATTGALLQAGWSRPRVSSRTMLIVGAGPTVATVMLEWLGVWYASNPMRAVAGLGLGAAVGLILANAAATLHYERCARRRSTRFNPPAPHI